MAGFGDSGMAVVYALLVYAYICSIIAIDVQTALPDIFLLYFL